MRRSIKIGLLSCAVVGIAGGTTAAVAFAATDTVTLKVDGNAKQVHTRAGTVGKVLADAGGIPSALTTWSPPRRRPASTTARRSCSGAAGCCT